MDTLGCIYAVMWLAAAGFLLFYGKKLHKILWLAGGMFLFMSVWQFIEAVFKAGLFENTMGWIYRCILACFLLALLFWYQKDRDEIRELFSKEKEE